MDGYKKISILILTYFSEKEIRACLDAVLKDAPDSVEVIVLDNHSQDATVSILEEHCSAHPLVQLYFNEENIGFARGVNQLAAHATGEYLFILNPDTIATEATYLELARYVDEHESVGVIGPRVVDEYGTIQESWGTALSPYSELIGKLFRSKYLEQIPFVKRFNERQLKRAGVVDVGWIGGAALMIRRRVWEKIGGLDTHFFLSHGDMVDLCMRVKALGYKIQLHSGVSIVHTGSKSVAHDRDRALYEAYDGTLYFFKKHYSRSTVLLVKAVYVGSSFLKALVAGIISIVVAEPYRAIARAHAKNAWKIVNGTLG
jgi:GT2 family glycosyltransferase